MVRILQTILIFWSTHQSFNRQTRLTSKFLKVFCPAWQAQSWLENAKFGSEISFFPDLFLTSSTPKISLQVCVQTQVYTTYRLKGVTLSEWKGNPVERFRYLLVQDRPKMEGWSGKDLAISNKCIWVTRSNKISWPTLLYFVKIPVSLHLLGADAELSLYLEVSFKFLVDSQFRASFGIFSIPWMPSIFRFALASYDVLQHVCTKSLKHACLPS